MFVYTFLSLPQVKSPDTSLNLINSGAAADYMVRSYTYPEATFEHCLRFFGAIRARRDP
jgi:hypothetical protein